MTRPVVFSPEAQDDLLSLYAHIAARSGEDRALAYTNQIAAYCLRLAQFPERGTRYDHLRPGLRTIGFRRQASVAFTITADAVTILRILYGGRDLQAAFADEEDG